ncbi:thioredoxin-like protein [Scheffersomyces amazonensis]|uniref:thioredoxin-like protein n=1 Tax=Scheffersomyces amazonensis TaxID=1078765 RepID=UPI00315D775B
MVSTRQFRAIGLGVIVVILVTILYRSNSKTYEPVNESVVGSASVGSGASVDLKKGSSVGGGSGAGAGAGAGAEVAGAIGAAVGGSGGISNLIESKNNDKQDEAINQRISKLTDENKEVKDSSNKPAADVKVDSKSTPDTEKAAEGAFDPSQSLLEIRSLSPMTIFSKTYCPFSKRIKSLLADNYEISPKYTVVELDKHEHGKELQAYLAEVTGRNTVPNVLVGASHESRGGADDFVKLHKDGLLASSIETWGNSKISVKKVNPPSNV